MLLGKLLFGSMVCCRVKARLSTFLANTDLHTGAGETGWG